MKTRCEEYTKTCEHCQRYKFTGPGYGHLPPRNDVAQPWEEVAVDLISPWSINLPLGKLSIFGFTIIDTTTTLAECVRIDHKTSDFIAMQFANTWLARHPKPLRCVHDQGTEFVGIAFQHLLAVNNIRSIKPFHGNG
jgi:hypothetical protein